MRLKTKFILVSLIGGLSSVAIVGVVAYTKAKRSIEEAVGRSCEIDAYETAKLVDRVIYNAHVAVQRLTQMRVMEGVTTGDGDGDLQTFLMNFARVNKDFVRVAAVNRNGEIIASSELDEPGSHFTNRALLDEVLDGRPSFNDMHLDAQSRTWVVTIAYPIPARYDGKAVIGMLCAQWRAEELSDVLELEEGNQDGEHAVRAMVLRKDGLLLAGSHVPRSWLFRRNLRSESSPSATAALDRKRGYLKEHTPDGQQALVGYYLSDVQQDSPTAQWITLVMHDVAQVVQPIRSLWQVVMIVAIVVTLGVLTLSVLVSQRLSAPIEEVATAAEEVAQGNFDVRVRTQSSDEVGRLADAFNQMVDELKTQRAQLLAMNGILRKSNEQLMAAQTSLMQADKMKTVGRLAAGVAHEVKNPLAVVMMGIEYLATDYPQNGDASVSTVLKEMKESVLRADTIIRGLLDFSASSRWDVKEEDLNSAIEQSLQLVRHDLNKGRITVDKDLAENLPHLKLNRGKVEQVFINLFMNAAHAMPDGGTLSVRTFSLPMQTGHIGSASKCETVVAEVADSGSGIPLEILGKIFEPFFTTKPTGIGTGLGLCIVKNIIELHGGTISMANRPEGGAQATIMFNVEETKTKEYVNDEQETHPNGR